MWWLLAIIWVLCGIENYGRTFAYFQGEYKVIAEKYYKSDLIGSAVYSIAGPLATICTLLNGVYGYGYKFR